jgi:uncharacterized protein YbjT (DUF2867 family)
MKAILFGATGMVGQGVLRECLLDLEVTEVLAIGRSPTGRKHPKLHEIVRQSLFDLSDSAPSLKGYDACFFCLGVSSAGMKQAEYRRLTHDLTIEVARVLVQENFNMTFLYVSGAGTDSSERGRTMWARVKGKTENDLFQAAVQGGVHVAPWIYPAAARNPFEGGMVSGALYRGSADVSAVEGDSEKVCDHDRRLGTRDDQDRQARRAEAHLGESGH